MPLMQLSFYSLTIFSYEENSHTIFLEKEIFHPLTQRSFLHFFFFLIIIPFSSVKESFFISSLFHLLFQNKFFLLSRRFFHFFFLRFFTSLKSMVPLSARSLISDETAQSRNEGLFSYKGNQAAIQMRQFRFHRQLHRGWRGLLIVPICCLLHVLMFFLQRFLFGT